MTQEAFNEIGHRIAEARGRLEWSEADLARRVGVDADTVAEWENGSRDPRANRVIMLAGVLGVTAHWLLDGNDEHHPDGGSSDIEGIRGQVSAARLKIMEMTAILEDMENRLDSMSAQSED